MSRELIELKSKCIEAVSGLTCKRDIWSSLRKAGIKPVDRTKESGYLNIHVPVKDGYVRIYKGTGMKQPKVQAFELVEVTYSGIPTFEPSGRRSF